MYLNLAIMTKLKITLKQQSPDDRIHYLKKKKLLSLFRRITHYVKKLSVLIPFLIKKYVYNKIHGFNKLMHIFLQILKVNK